MTFRYVLSTFIASTLPFYPNVYNSALNAPLPFIPPLTYATRRGSSVGSCEKFLRGHKLFPVALLSRPPSFELFFSFGAHLWPIFTGHGFKMRSLGAQNTFSPPRRKLIRERASIECVHPWRQGTYERRPGATRVV